VKKESCVPDHAIRAVIVDDEALARSVLREHLAAHPEVEIVAECGNGFEAVKAVAELRPDLVFLDIQMPKLDGFEVLELIGRDVAVIFVTAYDEYALRAFEVHAVDYLLKPFGPERLTEALEHARHHLAEHTPLPIAPLVASARPNDSHAERLVVRDGSRVHVIPVEKLDFVQAQDDYVCLHAEGKKLLKEQTMAEIEAVLDPSRFVRIHRSYILNIDRLTRVEPYGKDSRVAILADGTRLPVSRTGYARLNDLL
jgi:two-component system, LytTR family, response regulator